MLEADIEAARRDFTVAVELRAGPGERLALFGPSGAGKTTTLEVIAGLLPLRRGRVSLGGRVLSQAPAPGRHLPPWQRRVGLLRQYPGLFPHLSVRHNLCYGAPDRGDAITRLAAELGLDAVLGERPGRLSGGQAHRVALGRLLASRCEALLLDEPYTGLDAALRQQLTAMVRALAARREVPAVLVSHELAGAQAFADRLVVIDGGRLLADGAPDAMVRRPPSRRVAELVGYRGFVPLPAIAGAVAGIHPGRVVAGAHPGRGVMLSGLLRGARPAGAGWDVDLEVEGVPQRDGPASRHVITCRLDERPAGGQLAGRDEPRGGNGWQPAGDEQRARDDGRPAVGSVIVTALDPPCFGVDGILIGPGREVRA